MIFQQGCYKQFVASLIFYNETNTTVIKQGPRGEAGIYLFPLANNIGPVFEINLLLEVISLWQLSRLLTLRESIMT